MKNDFAFPTIDFFSTAKYPKTEAQIIGSLKDIVTTPIEKTIRDLKKQIKEEIMVPLKKGVKELSDRVKGEIENIEGEIKDFELKDALEKVKNFSGEEERAARDILIKGYKKVLEDYKIVLYSFSQVGVGLERIMGNLSDMDLIDKIIEFMEDLLKYIEEKEGEMGEEFKDRLKKLKEWINRIFDFGLGIKKIMLGFERIDGMKEKLEDMFSGLPKKIKELSVDKVKDIGKEFPEGILKGLGMDLSKDSFNLDELQKIIDKLKVEADDYMNPGFKANSTMLKMYLSALALVMVLIMKNDPFPPYERLEATNLLWIKFLGTDFVIKGSKSFGIPGQMPMPV